jgi:hypothetical protein
LLHIADQQFIEHFSPPPSLLQLEDVHALHPNNTPWIYYGGSYAGARAAHMRTQYPELVWGAIASSGMSSLIPCDVTVTELAQPSRTPRSTSPNTMTLSRSMARKSASPPSRARLSPSMRSSVCLSQ